MLKIYDSYEKLKIIMSINDKDRFIYVPVTSTHPSREHDNFERTYKMSEWTPPVRGNLKLQWGRPAGASAVATPAAPGRITNY